MGRINYIEASPRKDRSVSIALAKEFLQGYRQRHPEDEIHYIDLWEKKLPEFDGNVINAKYAIMHGKAPTEEQKRAWVAVEQIIEEFANCSKLVLSMPMWNYHIPYKLKHYLDILIQPTYAFSFDPQSGYQGLITGRPVALIYARGGEYPSGHAEDTGDFQKNYMEYILRFIGFTDFSSIVGENTVAHKDAALASGREQIAKVLATF